MHLEVAHANTTIDADDLSVHVSILDEELGSVSKLCWVTHTLWCDDITEE